MSSKRSAHDSLIWSFHSAIVAASVWPVPISWSQTAFVAATRSVPVFVVSRANSRNFSISNCWDNKWTKRITYENFHDKSYKIKLWAWSWFYEYGQKDIWKIKWHKQKQKITFEALYLKKKNYCRLHSTEFLQNKWDSKWHGADYVFTVSNR